jgi:hypothetical protein
MYKQAGNETIIMMDANDPIDSRPMDEFMDALDLWDLMEDYIPAIVYLQQITNVDATRLITSSDLKASSLR